MTFPDRTGLDILAFWRAIEYLTPTAPDEATMKERGEILRPEDREGCWNVDGPADLPWLAPLKPHYAPKQDTGNAAKITEKWRFVVTLGFSAVDETMAELRDLLGGLPDDEERPGGGREMAVASIVVTDGGQLYVSDAGKPAVAIAPLPWAMGVLRAGKHPTGIAGFDEPEGFEWTAIEAVAKYLEDVSVPDEVGGSPAPLSMAGLEGLCDVVTGAAGWRPRRAFDVLARVSAVKVTLRKDGTFGETPPALLGSFIAADLTTVYSALERGDVGIGLCRYLFGRGPDEAVTDVVRDPAGAAPLLSPAKLPAARWPSGPRERLVLAQQLAVNAAFERLKDAPGLFSVNGPPGTGKTTLLRDVVAAVIVERAKVLAGFAKPGDAFTGRIGTVDDAFPIWKLAPELSGFEIVVASSNNGAVENVTTELPGLKAIDPAWRNRGAGIFREVARTLLEDDPDSRKRAPPEPRECWALLSAVLGNRANRHRFVQRFWFAEFQQPKVDHWISFRVALEGLGKRPPNWSDACRTFRARLEAVETLRQRALAVEAAMESLASATATLAAWEALEGEIANHLALRPGWFDIFRPSRWIAWLRTGAALKDRFDTMTRALIAAGGRVGGHRLSDIASRLTAARALAEQAEATLTRLGAGFEGTIPDQAFFSETQTPVAEREKSSPWIDDALDEARKRCFLAALDLHRAFLGGAASKAKANLDAMVKVFNGKLAPAACGETLPDLWATLFLAVPVVSTTFASFPRLFEGMGRESLGWLLIDEAGQATPQAAAGAVWRARRSVVIGDPQQIEPVVPLPSKAIEVLREKFAIDDLWHPTRHSAQVLADRANTLGGHVGATWVGCPLRVHRRCVDPMFSVANEIAYDNLMVYGTVVGEGEPPSGPSQWLDVPGEAGEEGHFIEAQGVAALELIAEAQRAGALKDLYVISPFRSVAVGLKAMARKAKLPPDWIRTGIGTVHTFQGKEARTVLLVLGGHPGRPGAFHWAAEKPNLLNVALTRARRRVIVIGDRERWRQEDFFRTLADRL